MKSKKLKKAGRRRLIQIGFSVFSNGYLSGFAKGRIFTGPTKILCSPGLNCYSCPGALLSCPVGALQATLTSRQYRVALYAFGMITLFGAFLGRAVCGFLCPFGLLQDLLHRIPFFKKLKKLPGESVLRYIRYLVLTVLVIILPAAVSDAFGTGDPWFCKYVCPAGTLEAGIPLVIADSGLRASVGTLFFVKLGILVLSVIASVMIFRPFCRYLCPLGALYGLFNRFALYRYRFDEEKCTNCGACEKACELSIPVRRRLNSVDCIRCGDCIGACPTGAIGTVIPFPRKKAEQAKEGEKTS